MIESPSPRTSALAFTEGSRSGWIASDLIAWMTDHLVKQGRFDAQGGLVKVVSEPSIGTASLETSPASLKRDRVRTASQVSSLVTAARERVTKTLRVTVRSGETGFVNAALYAGRVSRERGPDGKPQWTVCLSEDDALSDQVLALFAADALSNPTDYEHEVCVCDACGAISFGSSTSSRHGCPSHPYGALDGKPTDADTQSRHAARS